MAIIIRNRYPDIYEADIIAREHSGSLGVIHRVYRSSGEMLTHHAVVWYDPQDRGGGTQAHLRFLAWKGEEQ